MTLADRLRRGLHEPIDGEPPLIPSDTHAHERAGGQFVPAAVLVAVVDRPEPGVLLTLRTETLRKHAGQVAFPGGRVDPGDDGPVAAALREAEEEIGLPPKAVEIVGVAHTYLTVTGYEITPVIGVIAPDIALTPHAAEVAEVFEVPLAFLLEPANHIERAVLWEGRQRRYFEMLWDERRIWGATAAMIINLGRHLAFALERPDDGSQ